ncbi:MAG: hypothetical protein QNK05_00515 [Myxococcota bacterium]|nr:hypothetical protein [Myxococcota bacterium]
MSQAIDPTREERSDAHRAAPAPERPGATTTPLALARSAEPETSADALCLRLEVRDPELLEALSARAPGSEREEFALTALRIGVLALRQAAGRIDTEVVRSEGERLLTELGGRLAEHRRGVADHLSETLRSYFDPESGRFQERVERLVRRDGELEALMQRQVGHEDSVLAHTLARHVGEGSPLMDLLSPEASDGLVGMLEKRVEESLTGERERMLREFSLDNKEGALSRLLGELGERHGAVGKELAGRIDEVVAEFSLDSEDSALSRLVSRVEGAQQRISKEFSLDHEEAALFRMRRELMNVLEEQRKGAQAFHTEVREALAAMRASREEARRSTRHGGEFEEQVVRLIRSEAQRAGDVASHVGATTGAIRHNKKGDAVIELGPDTAAPGARIVVEAKCDRSYDLKKALAECDEARRNREASIALFVYSREAAPEGLDPLARYGDDVVVVWDADDPESDVFLRAGLSVARALATRSVAQEAECEADLGAMDVAIKEIERQAGGFEVIRKSAASAQSAIGKIDEKARVMQRGLGRQVEELCRCVEALRTVL